MEQEPDNIGSQLRSKRETAGLTVEDVFYQTYIPQLVVNALEEGDFSVFSSPVYAKSFLLQYSQFLRVDAQAWLDALVPGSLDHVDFSSLLIEESDVPRAKADEHDSRAGWPSMFGVLALSAILVMVSLKGYNFFEANFGGESPTSGEGELPQATADVVLSSRDVQAVEMNSDFAEPPPRAIIVR